MDPLIGASLINAGGGILGGLGQMFMGESENEKLNNAALRQQMRFNQENQHYRQSSRIKAGQAWNQANTVAGQQIYDPRQGQNFVMDALRPRLEQMSGQYNQMLGNTSSGLAQKELADNVTGTLGNFFAQGQKDNAFQVHQNKLSTLMDNPYRGY